MKIKITLTKCQTIALEHLMSNVDSLYLPNTIEGKAIRSISFFVSDKINKAYRKQIKTATQTKDKKIVLSLEYHEAYALFQIINILLPYLTIAQDIRHEYQKTSDF